LFTGAALKPPGSRGSCAGTAPVPAALQGRGCGMPGRGHRGAGAWPGAAAAAGPGPAVVPQCRLPRLMHAQMSKNKKVKKIEARLSPIHGNGVFATEKIRKGERIIRYRGTLRTHEEVDEEYGDDDENGHTFLFTLNDEYVI